MVNTFISPTIGKASVLGVSFYEDTEIVELHSNDSAEAVETIIYAVYRQVLGNAYVMESERLTIPESKLKEGRISTREFIRQVAQSELYKSRFFDNCPRYRSIELNFKHLLGRAPDSYDETNFHSQILDRGGYEAEINSYIDSEEYQNKFGDNIVPYYCGYKTQTGKNIVGFTHLFKLLRGASSSDKKLTTQDTPRLTTSLIENRPSNIIPPSTGESYGGVTDVNKLLSKVFASQESKPQPETKTIPASDYSTGSAHQDRDTSKKIAELRDKLANINLFAAIGDSVVNKWQSNGNVTQSSSSDYKSQQDNLRQQQIIEDLETKIVDAQRLANIGEARLNRWRSRTFF
ncbi:MAG: phycobilisome rod-core linker polypeptide [Cyanobacteria bacterium P01_G01_bin.19]